jgi:hypothetical protein
MQTQTFPLDRPINLLGRSGHGTFTVTAQEDITEATVTITPRSKSDATTSGVLDRTVVELRGPTLVVMAPRQGGIFDINMLGGRARERDALDVVVTVPTGTAIKLSTVTADIIVNGRCGGADVAAGSATITLDDVDGDLRLRYGSGSARVGHVSGSVTVRSGSGDAAFGEIDGSLSAGGGSGNLEVTAVHGDVRSRAGSGAASFGAVHGDLDLARGSGGIEIGLPAGRPARLDVTTGSGRVSSELPIEDSPTAKGAPITVRARTGSGDIRLFRAAFVPLRP